MRSTALCACGHTAAEHADPATGDTRCLVVGERPRLEHVFDDGRDTVHADCACLSFTPAREIPSQRA